MLYEAFIEGDKICFIADAKDAQVLMSLFGKCTDDVECSETWYNVLRHLGYKATPVKGRAGGMVDITNITVITEIEGA